MLTFYFLNGFIVDPIPCEKPFTVGLPSYRGIYCAFSEEFLFVQPKEMQFSGLYPVFDVIFSFFPFPFFIFPLNLLFDFFPQSGHPLPLP